MARLGRSQPFKPHIGIPILGAANTYNVSVFDSVTISESTSQYITILFLSVFDNVTITENTKLSYSLPSPIVDSVTVSEAIQISYSLPSPIVDSVTVSENLEFRESLPLTIDSVTVSENLQIFESLPLIFDSVTVSESINLYIVTLYLSVFDNVTISENLQVFESLPLIFDSVTVSESVQITVVSPNTFIVNVSDSVTISEAIQISYSLPSPIIESITVSEAIQISYSLPSPITENVTVSENIKISYSLPSPIVDSVTVSESLQIFESLPLIVDSVTVSENLQIFESLPLTFESVTVSESVTVVIPTLVPSVFDNVTITEFVKVSYSLPSPIIDSVTVSENISIKINFSVSVSEQIIVFEPRLVFYDGFENGFSNWSQGGTAVITQDSSIVYAGSFSAKIVNSGDSGTLFHQIYGADRADPVYWSFAYYHAATTDSNTIIAYIGSSAGGLVSGFKVDTNGILVGKNADFSDGATIGLLSIGSWHIVEHWYNPVTGVNWAKIDGGTPTTWTNTSTTNWGGVLVGQINAANYTNYFDEINVYVSGAYIKESVTVSVFDSVTITENVKFVDIPDPFVFDSITVSESISLIVVNPVLKPSVFDSVTVSERINVEYVFLISTFDSITISENTSFDLIIRSRIFLDIPRGDTFSSYGLKGQGDAVRLH